MPCGVRSRMAVQHNNRRTLAPRSHPKPDSITYWDGGRVEAIEEDHLPIIAHGEALHLTSRRSGAKRIEFETINRAAHAA